MYPTPHTTFKYFGFFGLTSIFSLIFLTCARVHCEDKWGASAQSSPLQSSRRRLRKGLAAEPRHFPQGISATWRLWRGLPHKGLEVVFIHFSVHINSRKCYALQENEVPLAFSFHRFGTFPDIPPDVRSRPRAPSAAPTLQCPRGPRPSGPGRVTWSPMAGARFLVLE